MTDVNCIICKTNSAETPTTSDNFNITCPRCGHYFISSSAANVWVNKNLSQRIIANASGWIREHTNIEITSYQVQELLTIKTPSVVERANKILIELEKRSSELSTSFTINSDNLEDWLGISFSSTFSELTYLFQSLAAKNLLHGTLNAEVIHGAIITPNGYEHLENLRLKPSSSQVGFCAMWFDEKLSPIWVKAISPAISDAGYEAKRIDSHPHNNRIDDEIIAILRRSKFVVADFTGQRGGVYFEAGFALGLGLQVIWTCKEEELKNVHFDNRQYNFVLWEEDKLDEFKVALQNRIEATIGRGPMQTT